MTMLDQISDPFTRAAVGLGSGTNAIIAGATAASGEVWLAFFSAILAAFTPVLVAGIKQWVDKLTSTKDLKVALAAAKASKELDEATIKLLEARIEELEKGK